MLERDAITKVDLLPEVFYREEHQRIFEVISELDKKGKNIDLITVTTELKNKDLIEEIGGPAYITQLTGRVASAAHIEQHTRMLLQFYIRRELIRISTQVLQMSYDTSNELDDIMDLYEKAVAEIDKILLGKYTGRELKQVLKDLNAEIEKRSALSKEGGLTGISTGFGRLNKYTAGWQPGWLVILASRPGLGKTAIAVNRFVKEAARTGSWVNVFSLEMDDISLAERLVLGSSGIDSYRFKKGQLTDDEWEKYNKAVGELEKLPIYIDDAPYVKISHIRNVARTNKRKNKCDLIVIDYLQLANAGNDFKNRNREQEVSDMSRRLKALAKELQVPIILLSQLSRKVEERSNKRPVLSDLRDSGSIEQDADMVIFPWRSNYYDAESLDAGKGSLIIAKNRHGTVGDIEFYHNETMTDFSDEPFTYQHFDHSQFESNDYNPDEYINANNDSPF
jgi:replicative DNA helicase